MAASHGHPRPQLRRQWISLNGEWEFVIDPHGRWAVPDDVSWNARIVVPFAPETDASGVADTGFYQVCWYRRRFEAPALVHGDRLHVHFGAVDYAAAAPSPSSPCGRTFSTPALAYQAEHDNARRLLSLDLLSGRVDSTHSMWAYLLRHGASEAELVALVDAPCPPDVIGVNYYITSDRFLDERVHRYPAWSHGGNARQPYADVEAMRAWPDGHMLGHRALLDEIWKRYRLPVAMTEAHLGGTREDQLRWLRKPGAASMPPVPTAPTCGP